MRETLVRSFLTFAFLAAAQAWASDPRWDASVIQAALYESVTTLDLLQKKETSGTDYFSGEWPSTMTVARTIPFIGSKGKAAYDSNNFTVSSIHNMLFGVWQRQPELDRVLPMLDLSMERILSYRSGNGFNFWQLFDPWPPSPEEVPVRKVRRPNHFLFHRNLVAAGCDVYNDADDTAQGYWAVNAYRSMRPQVRLEFPEKVGPIFSAFRDVNRGVAHFYNLFRLTWNTGAFMTWLEEERPWDFFSYLPSLRRAYIPFGLNDVDCVVNANILWVLARYSELDTEGVRESCHFIESAFQKGRQHTCGVYYPSPYNLHYALARAYAGGATCLKGALDLATEEIIASQGEDGSWSSDIDGDDVHTSLYALNALLYAETAPTGGRETAVDRGIGYVLSQSRTGPTGTISWPEGVFFSGGTIARHRIYWKSEAYTVALAAEALSLYLRHL